MKEARATRHSGRLHVHCHREGGIVQQGMSEWMCPSMVKRCMPRVEGDARLEVVRDGKKCHMKCLGADVTKAVGLGRGKHRRVRTAGIAHREHEHWPEDSIEHEERRVCGAVGRTSGFVNDEQRGVAGVQAASVNPNQKEMLER